MIWFEYEYSTSSEILKNIKLITNYSIEEYALLIISIIILLFFIFYFVPSVRIGYAYIIKEKEKEKRKVLIKQIATQKDINDEIEKELNI